MELYLSCKIDYQQINESFSLALGKLPISLLCQFQLQPLYCCIWEVWSWYRNSRQTIEKSGNFKICNAWKTSLIRNVELGFFELLRNLELKGILRIGKALEKNRNFGLGIEIPSHGQSQEILKFVMRRKLR